MHVEKHILAYCWMHDQPNYPFIPSWTYLIYSLFNYPFFSWLMLPWLDRESPVFICMDLLCALPQLLPELWSQFFKEYFCLLKGNFLLMAIQSQIFFQTCHDALALHNTYREKLNSMNLLLYMAPIAVLLLIPATLIMEPDTLGITIALAREDSRMIVYLIFNSVVAYAVNLTNFLVTKHTSALTLQVRICSFIFITLVRICLYVKSRMQNDTMDQIFSHSFL